MEQAKIFFEEVLQSEAARPLLTFVKKPHTEEDLIEAYLDMAATLGVELTAEGIRAYFAAGAEAAAAADVDDEELAQLAGSESALCKNTYLQAENCWWNDGCDKIYNDYPFYNCKISNHDYGDLRDDPPGYDDKSWLLI